MTLKKIECFKSLIGRDQVLLLANCISYQNCDNLQHKMHSTACRFHYNGTVCYNPAKSDVQYQPITENALHSVLITL